MPIARFQMPDGRIARFEVPDGTTPEQAQELMAAHFQAPQKLEPLKADPTEGMGPLDTFRAGLGRGMTSLARGVGNLAGFVSDADMEEAKRLDAALLNTTGGKVGNVVGMAAGAAPTALIPGANTLLGASLIGSGTAALTTEGDAMERLKNAGYGAVGGAAGKLAGDALGAGARLVADRAKDKFSANQLVNAQRMGAAKDAAGAGYVIPPADLQPGKMTEALSGLSGKIKTAQVASQRNQDVTNKLAKQALGIADDSPLTTEALLSLRKAASTEGYKPITTAGEVVADATYKKSLDDIASKYQGAARSFPGAAKNPVLDMVEGLKQEKFDAGDALSMVAVLRESADTAFRSGNTGLGQASKKAAGALEDQIERHLKENGTPEAMKAFREARAQIAKTYTVQKALNPQTGDVSAQALAKELSKGRPLTGDLLTIAQTGQAFPKATQALKESPKATSPLDWAVGAMGGAGTGNPLMLASIAARPAVRSLLLSPVYQRAALRDATGPGALTQLPAGLLDQRLTRAAMPGLLGAMTPLVTSE